LIAVNQLFGAIMSMFSRIPARQANMAVYFAAVQPGRYGSGNEFVSRRTSVSWESGHFSGKLYKIVPYGVTRKTETIDFRRIGKNSQRA